MQFIKHKRQKNPPCMQSGPAISHYGSTDYFSHAKKMSEVGSNLKEFEFHTKRTYKFASTTLDDYIYCARIKDGGKVIYDNSNIIGKWRRTLDIGSFEQGVMSAIKEAHEEHMSEQKCVKSVPVVMMGEFPIEYKNKSEYKSWGGFPVEALYLPKKDFDWKKTKRGIFTLERIKETFEHVHPIYPLIKRL